jgi:site-specific DNA recombinase
LKVVKEYLDEGLSASKNLEKRESFKTMIADASSKEHPPIIKEDLFSKVQQKLEKENENFQNSYAHRTQYLLSRLVVCDGCGHNYLGTSAKSGKYNCYCCRTYLQRGRAACDAPLINKEKLEKAVLDQIQDPILSEQNVRKYIALTLGQAGAANAEPSAEEKAIDLSLIEVDSRIRRWEETLERGLLSLEDSARRIKELRQEREALLRRKVELQKKSRSTVRVLPIRAELMAQYVREMQSGLREKKIGYKRNSYESFEGGQNQRCHRHPEVQVTPNGRNSSCKG